MRRGNKAKSKDEKGRSGDSWKRSGKKRPEMGDDGEVVGEAMGYGQK